MTTLPDVPSSITEAAAALRSGTLTSLALVEACLARADALDPLLGVYIQRLDASALEAAATADAELAAGRDRGPLHGIPLGIKDIIAVAGSATTGQSLVHAPAWAAGQAWTAGQGNGDAPVVARLRAAGAVITGKTSTMEFAIGMPDATKPFPVPRNPWNPDHWTGGSSSGTGSGIAAGLFLGGLGTDTGGSIRIPAAFCGLSGLKQTYGLVPKSGCIPLGYSLDHIGPLARTAEDCLAMIAVLAGPDPSDPTCRTAPPPTWPADLGSDGTGSPAVSLVGRTVGVVRADHLDAPGVDPDVVAAFERAVEVLAAAGATIVAVELPDYDLMRQAGMVTSRAEASSYHALDLVDRWTEYGVHTSKAVSMGQLVSGADYVQAQRVRALVNARLARLLDGLDAVVMPAAGMGAPPVEGLDHTSFMAWPMFTQYWNPTGLPALVVPMGFDAAGLPLSLQIAGRALSEVALLTVGAAFQARTDWHRRLPPVEALVAVP